MDAKADARVRVVISVPGAPWMGARYTALIGACCGAAVCRSTALIIASMKMYALCSKKTGGVTTCQEIHKQGYLEHWELYILKSNTPHHFVSFHCRGLAKSLLVPHPCCTFAKRSQDKEEVRHKALPRDWMWGDGALSTTQQRLTARCCEYQKPPRHKHKIYKLIRAQV